MLVLSRKVGQEVVIAGNIKVIVNRISGNRVTIGVEAPKDVHILRGELNAFQELEVEGTSEEFTCVALDAPDAVADAASMWLAAPPR